MAEGGNIPFELFPLMHRSTDCIDRHVPYGKEKLVKSFIKKINKFTWTKVQGSVTSDFDESSNQINPRIKTGFTLQQGDFDPQEGFSARYQSRAGKSISLSRFIKNIQASQRSAIIGQPGSGKTIFMKHLARRYILANHLHDDARSKIWKIVARTFQMQYTNYDVVFYVNVEDILYRNNVSLSELLFDTSLTGLSPQEAQYGLEAVLKNKIKIVIFFDSLDQATWEPDFKNKIDPWSNSNTSTIFGNIMTHHILANVPIIISSREHWVASLSSDMRPNLSFSLCGFTDTDAKAVYCRVMGGEAAKQWDEICITNPLMVNMCRNPLFLTFYMIARKQDQEDPPDGATDVMIRIIQTLLEPNLTQNAIDIADVINKLKKMALRGTKEERITFADDDLETFGLRHKDITDVLIKVSETKDQKILKGIQKLIFVHKTLQEILTALQVVEMNFEQFKHVVDDEFHKPHWSFVRNFTVGILKNERVTSRISEQILKKESLKRKCSYLMKKLKSQLLSNPDPAQKLDILLTLKEANAKNILRRHSENLDISNSPLTPAMINVLCALLKYVREVPRLSLANCGIDDDLLEILALETTNSAAKVGELDMRRNVEWRDIALWRKIFENLNIVKCLVEIPYNGQNEENVLILLAIVKAADGKIASMDLGDLSKIHLNVKQLQKLKSYNVQLKIDNVRLEFDKRFSSEDWKEFGHIFHRYDVIPSWQLDYTFLPDLPAFAESYSNVKFRRLTSWSSYQLFLRVTDIKTSESSSKEMKWIDVELLHKHLPNQPYGVGELIRQCAFEELVYYWPYREIDVTAFAAGLKGFKIKLLAVKGLNSPKIAEIVRSCNVEQLCTDVKLDDETLNDVRSHALVTILSEDKWYQLFRTKPPNSR